MKTTYDSPYSIQREGNDYVVINNHYGQIVCKGPLDLCKLYVKIRERAFHLRAQATQMIKEGYDDSY